MENNQNTPNVLGEPEGSAKELKKPKMSCSCNTRGGILASIILLIVVVVVAGYLVDRYTTVDLFGRGREGNFLNNSYQSVFLSNGQVYFGKVTRMDNKYMVLEDIYYLQVSNSTQQSQAAVAEVQQSQLSLVKLGNELHGPQDKMIINNQHVLFTETLKEDSKVAQAILKYKESGNMTPAQ